MQIDMTDLIHALSDTVDLMGINDILHSKRVASMAWQLATSLNLDSDQRLRLFQLSLLHDCGISSSKERSRLTGEMDWPGAPTHCHKGAEMLRQFPPLRTFALPVRYHHTRWQDLQNLKLSEKVKYEANLLFMLDRVDYLAHYLRMDQSASWKDKIHEFIRSHSGSFFKSDLADSFIEAAAAESFWSALEPKQLHTFIEDCRKSSPAVLLSMDLIRSMASIFAQVVDGKSSFTTDHSYGVAILAKHLAEIMGLEEEIQNRVEIAGLLHDIGKVQIPEYFLDVSGPLSRRGLSYMRHHSYVSLFILRSVKGLEEVAQWAGDHHESLDGSGYPFQKKADELPVESRILIIADKFQALAQGRPYRPAKSLQAILQFLAQHGKRGRIDLNVVDLVSANQKTCYLLATASQRHTSSSTFSA